MSFQLDKLAHRRCMVELDEDIQVALAFALPGNVGAKTPRPLTRSGAAVLSASRASGKVISLCNFASFMPFLTLSTARSMIPMIF